MKIPSLRRIRAALAACEAIPTEELEAEQDCYPQYLGYLSELAARRAWCRTLSTHLQEMVSRGCEGAWPEVRNDAEEVLRQYREYATGGRA